MYHLLAPISEFSLIEPLYLLVDEFCAELHVLPLLISESVDVQFTPFPEFHHLLYLLMKFLGTSLKREEHCLHVEFEVLVSKLIDDSFNLLPLSSFL